MPCRSSECSPGDPSQAAAGPSASAAHIVSPSAPIQTLATTTTRSGRGSTKKRSRKKSPQEIHGAFTRAQQDSRLYNLKLDINDLKQELQDLAIRRELLRARSFTPRANSDACVLRTVGRYFHGFEPGYRGDAEHADQNAFVRSIVDEDFSLGVTSLGVDMLLEQWLRYTELFHVRETFLHSAEVITSADAEPGFVVAKCVMDFRGVLTRTAVDRIFPTACRDPDLLLQALGREIAIPMLFHLFFNEDGRLVRHDAVADFFGAVREALGGDISTAVRFIADAHVGQESMLGPVPEPVRDEERGVETMRHKKLRAADEIGSIHHTTVAHAYNAYEQDRSNGPNASSIEEEAQLEWTVGATPSVVSPSTDGSVLEEDDIDTYSSIPDPEAPPPEYTATVAWIEGIPYDPVEGGGGGRHSLGFLLSPP